MTDRLGSSMVEKRPRRIRKQVELRGDRPVQAVEPECADNFRCYMGERVNSLVDQGRGQVKFRRANDRPLPVDDPVTVRGKEYLIVVQVCVHDPGVLGDAVNDLTGRRPDLYPVDGVDIDRAEPAVQHERTKLAECGFGDRRPGLRRTEIQIDRHVTGNAPDIGDHLPRMGYQVGLGGRCVPCRVARSTGLTAAASTAMRTQTLRSLERDGLLTRTLTPTVPPRTDYELTELARSLLPIVAAIKTWAEAHIDDVAEAREKYETSHAAADRGALA